MLHVYMWYVAAKEEPGNGARHEELEKSGDISKQ